VPCAEISRPSCETAREGAPGTGGRQRLRRLRRNSSLTVRRFRPFFLRRARTRRPALVFIRARKPWSFRRFLLLGFLYVGCIALGIGGSGNSSGRSMHRRTRRLSGRSRPRITAFRGGVPRRKRAQKCRFAHRHCQTILRHGATDGMAVDNSRTVRLG
jgi:hypothetical protein